MECAGSSANGQKGRLFSSGYLFSIFFVGLGGLRRPNGFLIPEGGKNSEVQGKEVLRGKFLFEFDVVFCHSSWSGEIHRPFCHI